MKAKVKATGEIIDVEPQTYTTNGGWGTGVRYVDKKRKIYYDEDLDFENLTIISTDVKEKSLPKDEPDYWEKLKHQYAGMAMQGILSSDKILGIFGMQRGVRRMACSSYDTPYCGLAQRHYYRSPNPLLEV
jgi:hypothetical protein